MKVILKRALIYIAMACLLCACGKAGKVQGTPSPEFSADSAYMYISEQVAFGARIPGSGAHYECVRYLREQLERFGCDVELQQGQMLDYEGKPQQVVNIIGHITGGDPAKRRILLCAHYDSRPWADQEEDYDSRRQPVLGANDGASGVGVLLEIARQIRLWNTEHAKQVNCDIVFFDCEDMGTPEFFTGKERENTWCLGSQMWAREYNESQSIKSKSRSTYRYGILLDMVGAPDAVFPKEYYSVQYAGNRVEEVWRTADRLGYGSLFANMPSYPVTDDHYYINTIAGIPCIDIINYNPTGDTGFAHWWHTLHDDMNHISHATLEAVGKTVMKVIVES